MNECRVEKDCLKVLKLAFFFPVQYVVMIAAGVVYSVTILIFSSISSH